MAHRFLTTAVLTLTPLSAAAQGLVDAGRINLDDWSYDPL